MDPPTPSLLGLPPELRDQIYTHILKQTVRLRLFDHKTDRFYSKVVDAKQKAAYLTTRLPGDSSGPGSPILVSTTALAQVNRRFHAEISSLVCAAPVEVRVANFDFANVERFFASLTHGQVDAFRVRQDGTYDRLLTVELQGPYDVDWRRNLERWIRHIDSMGKVGPQRDEFATAHKVVANAEDDDVWGRVPAPLVTGIYNYHKTCPRGVGEVELYKILTTLHARYQVERVMECGRGFPLIEGRVGFRTR